MAEPRSTFAPVLLFGLASGILAAVASAQPWASGSSGRVDTANTASAAATGLDVARESPLAAALALVVLACWGVILVTRGRVRRTLAMLAAVTSLALLGTALLAFFAVQDALADALVAASGTDTVEVSLTGWYAAALLGATGSVLATAAAVRYAPGWPEMGSRYDAPAGQSPVTEELESNLEIWRALDEGHDPTRPDRPLD